MKFWDRVKKDLQIAMKEGGELFKEGTAVLTTEARRMAKEGVATAKKSAATVTAEAQRMTKVANLRLQLFRLNQKAQDKFAEIGGQVYDMTAKDPESVRLEGKVRKLVSEAKQIEEQIEKLKSEIDRLSKAH